MYKMDKQGINVRLNLLKGVSCMGVVFIHFRFPGLFGDIVHDVFHYAVPLFFMIAGYYAFGRMPDVIKRRLTKIVKIFVFSYLLYFLLYSTKVIFKNELLKFLSENYNWKTPIEYLFFCKINFAIPLWYLIAMIETYILWLYVLKDKKEQFVLSLTPILFLLQIIIKLYCETVRLNWFYTVNFFTSALPWFMLGYFLKTEKAKKVLSIKSSVLFMIAIIGCAIAVIPTALELPLKFNAIGYIPYTLALFLLALKKPAKSMCKPLEFIGEKLSLNIYIFHWLVNQIDIYMLEALNVKNIIGDLLFWFRPIFVLGTTIMVSWVIYKVYPDWYNVFTQIRLDDHVSAKNN